MALSDCSPRLDPDRELPAEAEAFVVEAERRIQCFLESDESLEVPAFVPSDARTFWRALAWVKEEGHSSGRNLCEWGSGFGVNACLGSMLGFRAYGIETHGPLVREAERLARDFRLEVDFVRGSFLPPGADRITAEVQEEFAWLDEGGADGHDLLEMEPDDFDLIAAYPWPGEERTLDRIFDRYAARGSLLITYHGREGLRVRRKVR